MATTKLAELCSVWSGMALRSSGTDAQFLRNMQLVDDNIKFAKVFNDNINEIAEAHHILLEKTLKEREIVFQRRRKKEKWVYRNNRVQQNDVR